MPKSFGITHSLFVYNLIGLLSHSVMPKQIFSPENTGVCCHTKLFLMKRSYLIITAIAVSLTTSIAADAQTSSRGLDNFDIPNGVQIYYPPSQIAAVPEKTTRRVKRKGKWVVEVVDKTPVNTPSKVVKTASVQSVSDGYAARSTASSGRNSRLMMGTGTHMKGFTTGNPLHDSLIVEASQLYRIDPLLIYAQMHQESSFKIGATSHKGASGLMQLMPATARRFGVTKIYDPKQNIHAGVRYMRWLLDTFEQDVVLALAGYNAGEGAVMKYGRNIPPYRETQEYVRRITSRYQTISDPSYLSNVRSTTAQNRTVQKDSAPLTIYEPSVVVLKQADGKMMLVNQ